MLIGSWLYASGYRVSFIFCPLRHWCGIICPSCGMTRAVTALVRGNWQQAIEYHLFAPLLLTMAIFVCGHSGWELIAGHHHRTFYTDWTTDRRVWMAIGGLFFGYYLLRLTRIVPAIAL
jgi:hypothetical protein